LLSQGKNALPDIKQINILALRQRDSFFAYAHGIGWSFNIELQM
jgi:hypothetical protein